MKLSVFIVGFLVLVVIPFLVGELLAYLHRRK